jgi:hypothetical protein
MENINFINIFFHVSRNPKNHRKNQKDYFLWCELEPLDADEPVPALD